MTDEQLTAPCPQCGSTAAVHSIGELAALARMQLNQMGVATEPQQGFAAEPQSGPVPGWAAQPQSGPVPGWAAQPQSGPVPGRAAQPQSGPPWPSMSAGARRGQRSYGPSVPPTIAAGLETMLRTQIAVAERHPDLHACLTDQVIFLTGGSRVLPFTGDTLKITVEQSDALVAQLRGS